MTDHMHDDAQGSVVREALQAAQTWFDEEFSESCDLPHKTRVSAMCDKVDAALAAINAAQPPAAPVEVDPASTFTDKEWHDALMGDPHPRSSADSAIADALERCDWANVSIGNKAVIRAAVVALRAQPQTASVSRQVLLEAQACIARETERCIRLEMTIRDSIEALERNSTSAPVVECLKAALSLSRPHGESGL